MFENFNPFKKKKPEDLGIKRDDALMEKALKDQGDIGIKGDISIDDYIGTLNKAEKTQRLIDKEKTLVGEQEFTWEEKALSEKYKPEARKIKRELEELYKKYEDIEDNIQKIEKAKIKERTLASAGLTTLYEEGAKENNFEKLKQEHRDLIKEKGEIADLIREREARIKEMVDLVDGGKTFFEDHIN